jgi:hypothetical protein
MTWEEGSLHPRALISEEEPNPGPWTRKQKECLDCLRSGERLRAGGTKGSGFPLTETFFCGKQVLGALKRNTKVGGSVGRI